MQLTIVLRKDVADETAAQNLFDIVKQKLEDFVDVKVTGQVSSQLILNHEVPE